MKILFYFIFITNLHSAEVSQVSKNDNGVNPISNKDNNANQIIKKDKNIYTDEDGDKITILDFESKKILSSTNEIKASNIYDDTILPEKPKEKKGQPIKHNINKQHIPK